MALTSSNPLDDLVSIFGSASVSTPTVASPAVGGAPGAFGGFDVFGGLGSMTPVGTQSPVQAVAPASAFVPPAQATASKGNAEDDLLGLF